MKLNNISIQNFRFFLGETSIKFSTDKSKPITMFVGENGGGKSSLMNALVWCFFNELIPGTDKPNEIKHDESDPKDDVVVAINFSHEGKDWEATRGISPQVGKYFILKSIDKNGVGTRVSSGEKEINRIIPKELRSWFFYSGESDLAQVNLSGSTEFKESLNELQGFTKVKTLIDDLKEAESSKRKDLERLGVNTQVAKLRAQIDNKERVLGPILESLKKINTEVIEKNLLKEAITKKIKELPDAKILQQKKESLTKEINIRRGAIRDRKQEQIALEGNTLPAILMYAHVKKYKAALVKDPKKSSLILEEPYGKKLFDKIMHDARCICGRDITPGSKEEKQLLALKDEAKPDTYNNRVAFLESAISEIEGFTESFSDKHSNISEYIELLQKEIDERHEDLKKVEVELRLIDNQEHQKLLDENEGLEKAIDKLKLDYGRNDQRKIDLERDISALEKDIEQSANKEKLYSGINKLLNNLKAVRDYAIKKLAQDEKKSLTIISHELNSLLSKYFLKNYSAKIDPNTYAVDLIKEDMSKKTSTGEMEVLKYFFITTVLGLASRKTVEKIDYLSEPTTAPLVMDAPFTGLSTDYTERVINAFLENLDQLIFLAFPEKFHFYESIIKEKVGVAYLIIGQLEGGIGIKEQPKKFKIFGKEYDFFEYGFDKSSAKIVKI